MSERRFGVSTIHLHRPIKLNAISVTITLSSDLSLPEPPALGPLNPLKVSLTIIENHNSSRPQRAKTRQDPHPERRRRIPRSVGRNRPSLITAHGRESSIATQPSRPLNSIVDHERGDDEQGTHASPGVEERVSIAGGDEVAVAGVVEGYHVSMGLQVFGQREVCLHVSESLGVDRYGHGHLV